jgi:hypothetical protein
LGRSWQLAAPLDTRPTWKTGPESLGKLTPGKHTIRVALLVTAAKNAPGKPFRALSNRVEITIERALPGSRLSVDKAIEEEAAFAAVCEAVARSRLTTTPSPRIDPYSTRSQDFKVVEVLFGKAEAVDRIDVVYKVYGEERAVGDHERVIWIGHTQHTRLHGSLSGTKALPDTPANRRAVTPQAADVQPDDQPDDQPADESAAVDVARPVDADARERFLAIERIARLPMPEREKQLPHLYKDLAPRYMNPFVEGVLSTNPDNLLDRKKSGAPGGDRTTRWAQQLADAASQMTPEQVADKLDNGLWLNVAARARAIQVLQQHPDATAALIEADLSADRKQPVSRATATILSLGLRTFTGRLLAMYLEDADVPVGVERTLLFLRDPAIVGPLLEEVEKDPKFLVRCAGFFQGPLYRKPAEPLLLELLNSKLAQPAVELAREEEARLRRAAAQLASNLPGASFAAVRDDLLPLLSDKEEPVRFQSLRCFAQQKDLAAGSVILEALKRDQLDEQFKVTVMQAMSKLAGSTFKYFVHEWGPDRPGNRRAIEQFEAWLRQRQKADGPQASSDHVLWSEAVTAAEPTVQAVGVKPDDQTPAGESAWGEAVEGVQVRLRAKQSTWNEGEVPHLSADVRNQGERNLLLHVQFNCCELEVDGQWYRPPIRGGVRLRPQPFPPDRQYSIGVSLHGYWELPASRIARSPWESGRLELTPGKHTIRVAFTATAAKNAPGKSVRAVSNPVEIEMIAKSDEEVDATQHDNASATPSEPTAEAKDLKPNNQTPAGEAGWGEAVEAVQVRLRARQSKWNEGTVPRLWADVRNQGKRNLLVRTRDEGCQLEVDGNWYFRPPDHRLGIIPPPEPLPPDRRYDDIAVDLDPRWQLAVSWIAGTPWKKGPKQLGKLTPGKHTIRVAFPVTAAEKAPGKPVRAVSNPVEIEVVAKNDEKADAKPQDNAGVTVAEPTVEATDAEPDDPTTALPSEEPSGKNGRPDGDANLSLRRACLYLSIFARTRSNGRSLAATVTSMTSGQPNGCMCSSPLRRLLRSFSKRSRNFRHDKSREASVSVMPWRVCRRVHRASRKAIGQRDGRDSARLPCLGRDRHTSALDSSFSLSCGRHEIACQENSEQSDGKTTCSRPIRLQPRRDKVATISAPASVLVSTRRSAIIQATGSSPKTPAPPLCASQRITASSTGWPQRRIPSRVCEGPVAASTRDSKLRTLSSSYDSSSPSNCSSRSGSLISSTLPSIWRISPGASAKGVSVFRAASSVIGQSRPPQPEETC